MTWGDGLRRGLAIFTAAAFTAVVTELLRREQRARGEGALAEVRRSVSTLREPRTTLPLADALKAPAAGRLPACRPIATSQGLRALSQDAKKSLFRVAQN